MDTDCIGLYLRTQAQYLLKINKKLLRSLYTLTAIVKGPKIIRREE